MNRFTTLVLGAVLLAGCGGYDPDEGGVTNDEDFKLGVATQDGTNMIVVVSFYDDFGSGAHFTMYLDNDLDGSADIQINVNPGGVDVHEHSMGTPGAITHSGSATISGPSVSFEIPITALNVTSPNTSEYWFHKSDSGLGSGVDRMPDAGNETIDF